MMISLAVISLPKSLLEAVKVLEGQPVEAGLRSIVVEKMNARLTNNKSKVREITRKYRIQRRLRRKVLRSPHEWVEDADLFEWEALLTENRLLTRLTLHEDSSKIVRCV